MAVEFVREQWKRLLHHPPQVQPVPYALITEEVTNGSSWDRIMYNPGTLFFPTFDYGPYNFHLDNESPLAIVTGRDWRTHTPIQYCYTDTYIGNRSQLFEIAKGQNAKYFTFGPAIYNGDFDTLPDSFKSLVVHRVRFPSYPIPTHLLKAYSPQFFSDRWTEKTKPPYIVGIWMDHQKLSGY